MKKVRGNEMQLKQQEWEQLSDIATRLTAELKSEVRPVRKPFRTSSDKIIASFRTPSPNNQFINYIHLLYFHPSSLTSSPSSPERIPNNALCSSHPIPHISRRPANSPHLHYHSTISSFITDANSIYSNMPFSDLPMLTSTSNAIRSRNRP